MATLRPRITYANVVATLALALAVSGGAYAEAKLPKNSVSSKQIKDGQVKGVDVADDGLTGADIAEGSLGKVPAASSADSASHATTAGSATSANTATSAASAASAADASKLGGLGPSAYAHAGSDPWTTVTTFNDGLAMGGAFNALCYWGKYDAGSTYPTAGYYRDPSGVVHLRGMVKATDGTGVGVLTGGQCGTYPDFDSTILRLPDGFTPEFRAILPATSNNKPARVDVLPDGAVKIEPGYPAFSDAKQWVSLDGIAFRCAPAGSNGCP